MNAQSPGAGIPDPNSLEALSAAQGRLGPKVLANYIVDALLVIIFCAMVGSGLVMEFVLGCRRGPGCARFGAFAEETVLGMRYETWAELHFYMAVLLVIMTILHVVLHWKLIVSVFARLFPAGSWRMLAAVVLIGICVFLLILPFMP